MNVLNKNFAISQWVVQGKELHFHVMDLIQKLILHRGFKGLSGHFEFGMIRNVDSVAEFPRNRKTN